MKATGSAKAAFDPESKMPDPEVSIVLPTFNGERYLAQSLASCLCQTFRQFEVIVVVDGSTDRTEEILANFGDERLRVLYHPQNLGLPAALNTGMKAARGKYLSWTSDDNLYRSRAIEFMMAALKAKPQFDVAYADSYLIDHKNHITGRARALPPPGAWTHGNRVGFCFLYSSVVQSEVGDYDQSLMGAEDFDFWLRAAKRFQFKHLNLPLYFIRNHQNSLTRTIPERISDATRATMARHLPALAFEQRKHPTGDADWMLIGQKWNSFFRSRMKSLPPNRSVYLYPTLPPGTPSASAKGQAFPGVIAVPRGLANLLSLNETMKSVDAANLIFTAGGHITMVPALERDYREKWSREFRLGYAYNKMITVPVGRVLADLLRGYQFFHLGTLTAKSIVFANHVFALAYAPLALWATRRRIKRLVARRGGSS